MAKVTVWVFIECADLTVEEMSNQIGITPDKSWRIGEPRGATRKTYETNSWSLESVAEVTEDALLVGKQLEQSLDEVLRRIGNHSQRFRELAAGRTAGIYVGIMADENPAALLKAATLARITALGVDLEVDLITVN